eukprot:CAMPEP_0176489156 /NCGR_PEP_ID=MMETSP0200_2-20121128/7126_1 /TAXON_ID=947934 /ORGANISM="Chaetoceros sp., Strain GSL56" /LENGTH=1024 /DNA_ID=CAMNT_0017886255 /DNA_START=213 /DNA_END=3287 /DNA_ORIENTATION=+
MNRNHVSSNTPTQNNISSQQVVRTYNFPNALHNAAAANQSNNLDSQSERSKRLARELMDFVDRGLQGILAAERGEEGAPSMEAAVELQLQIARMFRQIFPGNRELLYLVTEKNWMALLLGWMNQYDRPTVQVEAMLSLTTITDLCQQQYYQSQPSALDLSHFSPGVDSYVPNQPFVFGRKNKQGVEGGNNLMTRVNMNDDMIRMNDELRPPGNSAGSKSNAQGMLMNYAEGRDVMNARLDNHMNSAWMQNDQDTNNRHTVKRKEVNQELHNQEEHYNVNDDKVQDETIPQFTSNGQPKMDQVDELYYEELFRDPDIFRDPKCPLTLREVMRTQEKIKSLMSRSYEYGMMNKNDAQIMDSLDPRNKVIDSSSQAMSEEDKQRVMECIKILSSSDAPTRYPPVPTNASPNQIPLVGNYTQPLSVTSNNLLVRHPEAIPSFISLMTSPDKNVCENAMWVLGNIAAGEGHGVPGNNKVNPSSDPNLGENATNVTMKDIVLAAGAMGPLLRCMERFTDAISLQLIGSWVISTLVENKMPTGKKNHSTNEGSRIDDSDMELLIITLRRLLQFDDDDILSYTCWSLSHLCDGPATNIASIVTTQDPNAPSGGLVPRLVELLHHKNWRVTKPALRTIGNIVCAEYDDDAVVHDDKQLLTDFTEVILDCKAVPKLKSLINHENREIQKEACWTLSNIAAGTVDQIQAVIDSGAISPLVLLVNSEHTDQEVRSEACWVVLNATSCGSDQQIGVLVTEGCVSVLGLLLEETNMVAMALEGLERVLQVEEAREIAWRESLDDSTTNTTNQGPQPLVSASLIEKALNKNHKSAVTKRAQKIWNDHFVSCALCNQAYSKHRSSDAKFCKECKCYVCHKCNCEVYHLSYQEELWAAPDDKKNEKSKKSKNKKKKEKRKEKNKVKANESANLSDDLSKTPPDRDPSEFRKDSDSYEEHKVESPEIVSSLPMHQPDSLPLTIDDNDEDESEIKEDDCNDKNDMANIPTIDFSLYLQETRSIIAVSRLMDALDQLHDGKDIG